MGDDARTLPAVRVAVLGDYAMIREAIAARLADHLGAIDLTFDGDSLEAAVTDLTVLGADLAVVDLDHGPRLGAPAMEAVSDLVATGVPLLVLSGNDDPLFVRACLAAGALGFVSKRDSLGDLTGAADALLRREPFTSRVAMAGLVDEGAVGVVELSEQERRAALLYASGLTMGAVGEAMAISAFTAQEYIKRVRRKFADAGRPIHSKTELYKEFRREGLLA